MVWNKIIQSAVLFSQNCEFVCAKAEADTIGLGFSLTPGFSRVWTLAKTMEVGFSFSGYFNQFSISHLVHKIALGLLLQQAEQIARGGAEGFGPAPAGQSVKGGGAAVAKDADAAPQQHRIASDQKGRGAGDGSGIADLRLADAQQGLFVAEIDFDFPARHVSGDQLGRRRRRLAVVRRMGGATLPAREGRRSAA